MKLISVIICSYSRMYTTVEPVAWRYTIHGSMILTPDRCLADLAAGLGIDVEPLYLRGPLREPTQETKT